MNDDKLYESILKEFENELWEIDNYYSIPENIWSNFSAISVFIENALNPKAYTFEELKPNMWVYDIHYNVCIQIHKLYNNGSHNIIQFKSNHYPKLAECYWFEKNRFYPLTKANQGKK